MASTTGSAGKTDDRSVWIVGQWKEPPEQWEVQGVFTTADAASAACRNWRYFYGRVPLDQELPHGSVPWDAVYPIPRPA